MEKVREFRLGSKKEKTVEAANNPTEFAELRQPKTNFIIIDLNEVLIDTNYEFKNK